KLSPEVPDKLGPDSPDNGRSGNSGLLSISSPLPCTPLHAGSVMSSYWDRSNAFRDRLERTKQAIRDAGDFRPRDGTARLLPTRKKQRKPRAPVPEAEPVPYVRLSPKAERPPWPPRVTVNVLNVVAEQLHNLGPARV